MKKFAPLNQLFLTAVCGISVFASIVGLAAGPVPDSNLGARGELVSDFQQALPGAEVIGLQDERIVQAEESYRQAISGVLPTVSFDGYYQVQESGSTSSSFPSTSPLLKFSLKQPLFRGLREFAALRRTEKLREAEEVIRDRAQLLYYTDFVQAWVGLAALQTELADSEADVQFYLDRLSEVRKRAGIGRSRQTDVLSAESSLAAAQADQVTVVARVEAARSTLKFVSGREISKYLDNRKGIAPPGAETTTPLPPLSQFVEQGRNRSDIQAAEKRRDSAEEGVAIARGGHLPTADFSGNYYLLRSGSLENVNWDLRFDFSLPLWSGGLVSSQTRAASSVYKYSEIELAQLRRKVDTDIEAAYARVASDRGRLPMLEKAFQLAEKSYQIQMRDFRLGLISNLELLQSLEQYQTQKRAWHRACWELFLDRELLQAAAGRIPRGAGV